MKKMKNDKPMSMEQIRSTVSSSPSYRFLKDNPNLGDNVVLLGLGGSYAYGMAKPDSDIDLRGIALNSKSNILRGDDFCQVIDEDTDTTVYSLDKMVRLLLNNNPNTIEILGLAIDQLVFANFKFYKELKDLEQAFLSKKCINSFGGYANSQLRRLGNKAARERGEEERERHVINSIMFAQEDFKTRYPHLEDSMFRLYVDKSVTEGHEYEIFIDVDKMEHMPFREYWGWLNEYNSVLRGYDLGDTTRNKKATAHEKLDKHSAHLMRLYYMCFDILEHHKVVTYRSEEHDLLMRIRNGEFIGEDKQPTPEFYKMVDEAEDKLKRLAKTTTLPEEPDYERVYKWLESVNERVVLGTW